MLGKLKNGRLHPNNSRDYALVMLFKYTGVRRGEAARLRVGDVDFDNRRIRIAPGKNGEARVIPLHPVLGNAIGRYIRCIRDTHRHSDLPELWLGRDGPLRPNGIDGVFRRVSEMAGLTVPLATHQLRRRLAKTWIHEGGADDALMFIAGWRPPTMRCASDERSGIGRLAQPARRRRDDGARGTGKHHLVIAESKID